MRVDLGFWNQQGEYIQDIQEINEMDMDKYFEELNDMANFKNFGESKEKEITIDGVDVAGCEYLRIVGANWWCECNNGKEYGTKTRVTACGGCKYNPDCYYKQLKRLEQENAELKAELHSKTEFIQEQREIIDAYRKEVEMYKKCQGKRASKREEALKTENERLKEATDGLLKIQYTLADSCKKYSETLQEIKDIAKGVRSYLEVPAPRDVRYEMDRILDLITKAEEEE